MESKTLSLLHINGHTHTHCTNSLLCVSEVVTSLKSLPGVGPKVADCVAMMSCDKLDAVPIDTHVWSLAVRDYGLARARKSLTSTAYAEIGMYI